MRFFFVKRYVESDGRYSPTTVDCTLDIEREGDYWVACVSCPPSDHPHNCARAGDLAQAVRWVLPCYREHAQVLGKIENEMRVMICEQYR